MTKKRIQEYIEFFGKFHGSGDNMVEEPYFSTYDYCGEVADKNGVYHYPDYLGAININPNQCFLNVPTSIWEFSIGTYKPIQRWIKNKKGKLLSPDDIQYYQQLIIGMVEAGEVMQQVKKEMKK